VTTTPVPMLLPNNQFDHFYRGGDRIKTLRGGPGGPQRPEEWIASATTRAGQTLQGLSTLPSRELLRDAVRADPTAWLGPAHVERYGADGVELLVKLLDAGQRLPVHVHPTRAFAREHLDLAHGKTEAWVVVEADPGAVVGIGLRRPNDPRGAPPARRRHDSAALVDARPHRWRCGPATGSSSRRGRRTSSARASSSPSSRSRRISRSSWSGTASPSTGTPRATSGWASTSRSTPST
jgi:hypothetical protein